MSPESNSPAPGAADVTHVDDWLATPSWESEGENYAKFFLDHARRPAWMKVAFAPWMKQHRLFCTYEGKRYRCTGASRLGDVWLTENFAHEAGYEKRVDVAKCSEWSPTERTASPRSD